MFRDHEHFMEELAKSLEKDMEELEKAAPNVGGGGNDATGVRVLQAAHAKKQAVMEDDVERLEGIASKSPPGHGSHASLARAKKQLEVHMRNKPR